MEEKEEGLAVRNMLGAVSDMGTGDQRKFDISASIAYYYRPVVCCDVAGRSDGEEINGQSGNGTTDADVWTALWGACSVAAVLVL